MEIRAFLVDDGGFGVGHDFDDAGEAGFAQWFDDVDFAVAVHSLLEFDHSVFHLLFGKRLGKFLARVG